jgi:hypothetical protein
VNPTQRQFDYMDRWRADSMRPLRGREISIDLFCGGGGASLGIEAAIGAPVDEAINHSLKAIHYHEQNHPATNHHSTDVFDVHPLAENTMRRIARGVVKFVINHPDPFIVPEGAAPFITEYANASNQRNMPADEPLRTICAQVKGGHFALVAPFVERMHGMSSGESVEKPLSSLCAQVNHHAVVSAFLAKHYTGVAGSDLRRPRARMPRGHRADHVIGVGSLFVPKRGEQGVLFS